MGRERTYLQFPQLPNVRNVVNSFLRDAALPYISNCPTSPEAQQGLTSIELLANGVPSIAAQDGQV